MVAVALLMVVFAVVLFAIERIPMEVSSLTLLVMLVATGLLTAEEALAGFSSETVMFIFALLAMTQGLAATGVMRLIGLRLTAFARFGPRTFVAAMLTAVCVCSSVASNTAVTAAFLPIVIATAAQVGVPKGRLLMPMAFASMLGGTIFLFGTSTNLVTSAAMADLGLGPIGFAELAPMGLPLAAASIALLTLFGGRLLRARDDTVDDAVADRDFVAEAVLTEGSRLAGKPLSRVTQGLGIPVVGVVREGRLLPPEPGHRLAAADHLVVRGRLGDILKVRSLRSLQLWAELVLRPDRGSHVVVEAWVPPTSALVGRSVRRLRFADRYGLVVLGLHRHPALQRQDVMATVERGEPLRAVPLAEGDVLLLSGPEERIRHVAEEGDLAVLGAVDYDRPRYDRAALALLIFGAAVATAGLQLVSPAIAGLAGMLAMIATGCVPSRTAFRVDWRIIILIASLLALGRAVEKSGAGRAVAEGLIPLAEIAGPRGVLAVVMLLTVVLSVPMSNQAAALVVLPIAVHAAMELGVDPRPFAIGTCLAASCAFLTPLEPSAALVFGPGRYRFADFLRVGTPLTVLAVLLLTFGIPLVWPLEAR